MILRKINAVVSLATTVLLLDHAISHSLWMLSDGSIVKYPICTPWILFALMMFHAIISIAFAILGHKGAEKKKCKSYANLNVPAFIQRATGVSLIVLTTLHVAGAVGVLQPPKLVHGVLLPVFFAICMLHTAISTNKAFITLGIGNAAFIKISDVIIKLICGATLIAGVIGFYNYLG